MQTERHFSWHQYIASQIWEQKTGQVADAFPHHAIEWRREAVGAAWEEDLDERFPKLSKKYQ